MDRLREREGIAILALVFLFFVIPILIVSLVAPIVNDYGAYFRSFYESDLEYSKETIDEKYRELLTYIFVPEVFATTNNDLDRGFFSPEDIYHLEDVRKIYLFLYMGVIIGLGILIWSASDGGRKREIDVDVNIKIESKIHGKSKNSKELYKFLSDSNRVIKVMIIVILLFSLLTVLFWSSAFTLFHQLLFPQNTYWLLDPASSNLIKYFSEQFFQSCFATYLFLLLIEYAIFQLFIRWTKKKGY